jgi:hypothetical protein
MTVSTGLSPDRNTRCLATRSLSEALGETVTAVASSPSGERLYSLTERWEAEADADAEALSEL